MEQKQEAKQETKVGTIEYYESRLANLRQQLAAREHVMQEAIGNVNAVKGAIAEVERNFIEKKAEEAKPQLKLEPSEKAPEGDS